MKAAQSRNCRGVQFLIDHKANVNQITPDGRFALLLAAINDFEDICELLLMAGTHNIHMFHAHIRTGAGRSLKFQGKTAAEWAALNKNEYALSMIQNWKAVMFC